MTIKILSVVGARPQFIKAAPITRALKKHGQIEETLLHTGQHYDANMSDVFFKQLEIAQPKYNLNIHGGSHGDMTARMLTGIETALQAESFDAVLVYGDTNSTLAGALAASKMNIPVLHVEAGLRSYNRSMPEEINRVLTDHVSALLFCPTFRAIDNLKREGITDGAIHVGDVMFDACLHAAQHIVKPNIDSPYALMTLHRQSTTENAAALKEAVEFANKIAANQNLNVVFPVHPRTRDLYKSLNIQSSRLMALEPAGYFETQGLLKHAQLVLTDSGGLQKEAYFHQVPCITMRSETEWVETIESGWNRLWSETDWKPERKSIADYGDGHAAETIADHIARFFQ